MALLGNDGRREKWRKFIKILEENVPTDALIKENREKPKRWEKLFAHFKFSPF